MNEVISAFLGGIILFPFIPTILFMVIQRKMGKAPASNLGISADVTTPLLFLAVYVVSKVVFGQGVWVYIIGGAIVIAIVYAFFERSKVKEFQIVRLLRKIWRFYFLVLLAAYIILLITGVVIKIVEYVR